MALGDFTAKEFLHSALTATAADKTVAGEANKRKYTTGFILCNTGSTARTVTIYKGGTAAANTVMVIPVAANGLEILTEIPLFLDAADTLYIKQDTGTDVIATITGSEEALA